MKQIFILCTLLLLSTMSHAQFEISASGGYAIGSAGMKLGEEQSASTIENTYGSYGEGLNAQLRGTYFFNEHIGADLSLGYLHGDDQTVSKVRLTGYEVDAVARARAFGAAASLVYRFNANVYTRLGALVKLGGKTEAVVHQKANFTQAEADAFGVPFGSYTDTNYIEDYHGHFPLGFIAAIGYKHQLNATLSLFVEAEYYGISLKRKDSELTAFNTNVVLPDGTVAVSSLYSLDNLPDGVNRTTTYVDDIPTANTDTSKELSVKVPYSSFGINFGIIYKFKRKTADKE